MKKNVTRREFLKGAAAGAAGFAGLFAALSAKEAGQDVLLVDKGRPGYSGLSAWASSHCYFDADFGDSEEGFEYAMKYANEFLANLDWVKVWMKESKSVYETCTEPGILNQYPKADESGYWVDGTTQNDKRPQQCIKAFPFQRNGLFQFSYLLSI